MRDLVDQISRKPVDAGPQIFRAVRPDRVRVGIVAFPHDEVRIHVVDILQTELVIDEAGDDVVLEHVAGTLGAKVGIGPFVVVFVREIGPFQEVGNPADSAF